MPRKDYAPKVRYICWVDRGSSIVVRGRRAARLGFLQLGVFLALHEQSRKGGYGKKLSAKALADIVYNGVINPSNTDTIRASIHHANRKLARLGLKIRGVNRKQNSFYQIVVI